MSKKRTYFFSFLFILFAIGFFVLVKKERLEKSSFPIGINIEDRVYHLEIADTETKRTKGLGERASLCGDCGMLFLFDVQGRHAFWMKDMRFPIDIIWLRGDEVVFVEHAVQPEFRGILDPAISADKVLEINAGEGKKLYGGEKIRFVYE